MAKFKDLHLLMQDEQRILLGPDALGDYGPTVYPAQDPGNEKAFIGWTTISGYNTTLPGSGTTSITPIDEVVISVPLAGERATEPYHMVRYDQLLTWSGIYPNHCDLQGLDQDCHLQYVPTDGSRGFTNTVSGVYPVLGYHLVTKDYVDDEINTLSGTVFAEFANYVTLATDQTITGAKTFTNTTTFSGVTYFDNDVYFGDNTISGTGDIYTGNIYADNMKWGRIACINNATSQAVTFDNPWPDDDYTIVATLTNEVDAKPSIYSTIQGVKTGGGFTTHFSGKIDSNNFVLEWHAFYGQKH